MTVDAVYVKSAFFIAGPPSYVESQYSRRRISELRVPPCRWKRWWSLPLLSWRLPAPWHTPHLQIHQARPNALPGAQSRTDIPQRGFRCYRERSPDTPYRPPTLHQAANRIRNPAPKNRQSIPIDAHFHTQASACRIQRNCPYHSCPVNNDVSCSDSEERRMTFNVTQQGDHYQYCRWANPHSLKTVHWPRGKVVSVIFLNPFH